MDLHRNSTLTCQIFSCFHLVYFNCNVSLPDGASEVDLHDLQDDAVIVALTQVCSEVTYDTETESELEG